MTATMAVSGVCAAAGEGSILNKDQKAAEALLAGLNGEETATYATATAGMVPELKAKVTEEAYNNLKKNVKEKLGTCKESTFRTYDHFHDGDRLVYVGKYTKEENVVMFFVFNPAGKIMNFSLSPVKPQQQAQQPAK